jgi:hypothetical protein
MEVTTVKLTITREVFVSVPAIDFRCQPTALVDLWLREYATNPEKFLTNRIHSISGKIQLPPTP